MAQHNASKVFLDTWFVRIGRIIAWAWGVFWALMGLVSVGMLLSGEMKGPTDIMMVLICLGLAGLHAWLLLFIRNLNGLLKDFRLYCAVFAKEPDKSIPALSAALNVPLPQAMERLQRMCRRGYFNGYIDHQQQRLLFYSRKEQENIRVAYCPGCGARNAISKKGDLCRYCGSPLP